MFAGTTAGGSVSALATGGDSTASVFSSAVAAGGATALADAIAEAASSKLTPDFSWHMVC